jgi:hypothetical protein
MLDPMIDYEVAGGRALIGRVVRPRGGHLVGYMRVHGEHPWHGQRLIREGSGAALDISWSGPIEGHDGWWVGIDTEGDIDPLDITNLIFRLGRLAEARDHLWP